MRRRALALLACAPLVVGACSDDGPGRLEAGDGFSIEAALAELPAPDEDGTFTVGVGDLDAATEAAGVDRGEAARWARELGAGDGSVFTPLPRSSDRFPPDERGWAVTEVAAFAEVLAPGAPAAVLVGDLGEVPPSLGEGDEPLRQVPDGDRLLVTADADAAEAWPEGDGRRLADDEDLRAVAAELDDEDVLAAMLLRPEEPFEGLPYRAVGVGWAVDDGEAEITLAWAFPDDGAADDARAALRTVFDEGASLRTRQPLAELLALEEIDVEGSVVVASARLGPEGRARTPADLLIAGDLPFRTE